MKKIAIVNPVILMQDVVDNVLPQLRYNLFNNLAVLHYKGKTIQEILEGVEYSYRKSGSVAGGIKDPGEGGGGQVHIDVEMKVSSNGIFRAVPLGEFEGIDCWALLDPIPNPTGFKFSIDSMPHYGKVSVCYQPHIVKESYESFSKVTAVRDIALFDFINSQVEKILEDQLV